MSSSNLQNARAEQSIQNPTIPWRSLVSARFWLILFQLGLLSIVIRQFQIESSAFLRVALLSFAGFVVHALLPQRFRLPFFLLLSIAGIAVVFGIHDGAWLVGIGLGLIGVCHLPIPYAGRAALLVLIGAMLVIFRLDWLHAPWPSAIWPILASMFMFRLIVYLYDLRHEQEPVSVWRTLSYFFLLPNVCFPLFPVVDYKTFRRTYYNDDPCRIYQLGVDWMARGVMHLLLYRLVYQHFTLAPSEVNDLPNLVQFLLSNFLLYLRVSGQFHVIVGMLHLFGFHLPESHHRYYLASSFTDFWRRINIYWKDFMLKVFYYPMYFRLRKLGNTQALVISTLSVFILTWFLHAYQWFWLRGTLLLSWQDVGFWAILGLLVVVNAVYESRHGRQRALGKQTWSLRRFAPVALKTVGTFCAICVLWSLWTAESLSSWVSLWSPLFEPSNSRTALLLFFVVGAGVVQGDIGPTIGNASALKAGTPKQKVHRFPSSTVAILGGLALIGIQEVYTNLGPSAATFINSLRSGKLSRLDNAKLERGYYEQLLEVDRFNSQLWDVYMKKPTKWLDVQGAGLERFTQGFNQKELIPSFSAATSYGVIRTNRWGMRDQEYEKEPPADTFRIGLLGASSVMGWGVQDGETFESLLEARLNTDRAGNPYGRYEILNFGVPGYQPLQQIAMLDKAIAFGSHAIFYVATGREAHRCKDYLVEVVRKGIDIPHDYLRDLVARSGIDSKMPEAAALRRLDPFRNEMLIWLYRHFVTNCREKGIVPVWIFLPMTVEDPWQDDTADLFRIAKESGFIVLNLIEVFKNQDIRALRVAEWDTHPNSKAHRLIASKFYDSISERRDEIFVPGLVSPVQSVRHTRLDN